MSRFIKLFFQIFIFVFVRDVFADLVYNVLISTVEAEPEWESFDNISNQVINNLQSSTIKLLYDSELASVDDGDITVDDNPITSHDDLKGNEFTGIDENEVATTAFEEFTLNKDFQLTGIDEDDEIESESTVVSFNLGDYTIKTNSSKANNETNGQSLDVDQFTTFDIIDDLTNVDLVTEVIEPVEITDIRKIEEEEVLTDSDFFDIEGDTTITNEDLYTNQIEQLLSTEKEFHLTGEELEFSNIPVVDQQITEETIERQREGHEFEERIENYLEQRAPTEDFKDVLTASTKVSTIKSSSPLVNNHYDSTSIGTESSFKNNDEQLFYGEKTNSLQIDNFKDVLNTTEVSATEISSFLGQKHHENTLRTDNFADNYNKQYSYNEKTNSLGINKAIASTRQGTETTSDVDEEVATEYDETEMPDYVLEDELKTNGDNSTVTPQIRGKVFSSVDEERKFSTDLMVPSNAEVKLSSEASNNENIAKFAAVISRNETTYTQLYTGGAKITNKYFGEESFTPRNSASQMTAVTTAKEITGMTENMASENTISNIGTEIKSSIPIIIDEYPVTNKTSSLSEEEASNTEKAATSTSDFITANEQWLFTEKNQRVSRAKQEIPTENSTIATTEFNTYTRETHQNYENATMMGEIVQSTPDLYEETIPLNATGIQEEESATKNITSSSNTTTTDEEEYTASNVTGEGRNRTTEATSTTEIPIKEGAIKDIAYYLRAHKFNEYDRRYETKPEFAPRNYFKEFPRPPLRSLHWEVRKFCEPSFHECVEYLRKRISQTGSKRADDTVIVMQEQGWTMTNNSEQIKQVNEECKKLRKVDDIRADPFEGPLERFQWRSTASYYMCWYTMRQVPELKHLSESCDNYANCLDTFFGPYNGDRRADDVEPYSCALYSFCPDPCCSDKHLARREDCWESPDNLCFDSNPPGQRQCAVNPSLNTDFRDLVLNRWNVTCRCPAPGREWNSLYGMCVDVDECTTGAHGCDKTVEACVNLEGSFRCACKWGHIWDGNKCVPSAALGVIKLGRKNDGGAGNETLSFFKRMVRFFKGSNESNTLQLDSLIRTLVTAFILCCVLNEFGMLF